MSRRLMIQKDTQRGAALPLVLLVLLFVTLLGTMALNTSSIEVRLAGNERNYQQAVYVAEAGVNHMRARLKQRLIDENLPANWSFALTGDEACNPPIGPGTPVRGINSNLGSFSYEVCIYDNIPANDGLCPQDDPTAYAPSAVDADNNIYVCSQAVGPQGTRASIEVILEPGGIIAVKNDSAAQAGGGMYKTFEGRDRDAIKDVDLDTEVLSRGDL
jgi:Tfp pilus assembly protein PilX